MAFELPAVKVCGLSRAADIEAAVRAGADALGFVRYAPSPRDVSVALATELIAGAPDGVWTVLVLVDADPEATRELLRETGAGCVQLCGTERPGDWRGFDVPILRRVAVSDTAQSELDAWRAVAAGFVLDHPSGPGGSGRTVETAAAAELARLAPCLLAGGLDAGNVAERVERVRPRGVDGSSRLESAPGVKDPGKIQSFVRNAREALLTSDKGPHFRERS